MNFLIDPSFQGETGFLFYHLKIMNSKQARKDIFFPTVEIKDYSVMIDRKNLFVQPEKMIE